MRKKTTLAGLIVLLALTSTVCAEGEIAFDLTADYMGKYVWRGQNLSDDPVFQPGISMTYKQLTVGFWGSMDTSNINDRSGDFTELDTYVDWSDSLPGVDGVGYSLGLIYYDFPGSGADGSRVPDTTEFYWGFSFDLPLSPSVTVYHDLDETDDGMYVSFGVGHTIENLIELSEEQAVPAEISASLGWGDSDYNMYYWNVDESKLNDLTLSVAFPVEIGSWTLTPSMNYVTLLADDLRKTDTYNRASDYFFVGVGLSTSF